MRHQAVTTRAISGALWWRVRSHQAPRSSFSEGSTAPGRRRYKILFGLAAVAAFLLALPAAAPAACVSASACTGGGGIVIIFAGHLVCSGGSQAGQSICGGSGSFTAIPTDITLFHDFQRLQDQPQPGNVPDATYYMIELGWAVGTSAYTAPPASTSHLGGPVNFSMYSSNGFNGPYAGADIFSVHNSGYRTSDSAGAIAPGSLAPGFNSLGGGGGFTWTYDASRTLGLYGNDRLLFGLGFDYQRQNTSYGTSVLTPGVANAGSTRDNIYTLTGSVAYAVNGFHASGVASYDWSNTAVTNNLDGGTGNTNGQGYGLGGSAGYSFLLMNTTGVTSSAMPTKAPPPTSYSGYAMFLDLNGHVFYQDERNNGYTDSSGFVFGTERVSFTDLGAHANLVTAIPTADIFWMPYVGVSLDHQFGFSHTFDLPAQAATPADTIFFNESTTFWTVNAGLNIVNRANLKAGLSAFYSASSDTNIVGGNVFLKIPFYPDPPSSAASGIRAASK